MESERKQKSLNELYEEVIIQLKKTSYFSYAFIYKTEKDFKSFKEKANEQAKNGKTFRDLVEDRLDYNLKAKNGFVSNKRQLMIDTGYNSSSTLYELLDNPNRNFAIACAIDLGMNYEEANELLCSAGISLYERNRRDCFIKACLINSPYKLDDVNVFLENSMNTDGIIYKGKKTKNSD